MRVRGVRCMLLSGRDASQAVRTSLLKKVCPRGGGTVPREPSHDEVAIRSEEGCGIQKPGAIENLPVQLWAKFDLQKSIFVLTKVGS